MAQSHSVMLTRIDTSSPPHHIPTPPPLLTPRLLIPLLHLASHYFLSSPRLHLIILLLHLIICLLHLVSTSSPPHYSPSPLHHSPSPPRLIILFLHHVSTSSFSFSASSPPHYSPSPPHYFPSPPRLHLIFLLLHLFRHLRLFHLLIKSNVFKIFYLLSEFLHTRYVVQQIIKVAT